MIILKYLFLLVVSISTISLAGEARDVHHLLTPLEEGGVNVDSYFDSRGIADLHTDSVCRDDCSGEQCCYPVIRDIHAKTVYRSGRAHHLDVIAKGRYEQSAYLLFRDTYDVGKAHYSKTHLIDATGRSYSVPAFTRTSSLAQLLSKDRHLIQVFEDGVYKDGRHQAGAEGLVSARIVNDPQGDLAVVALDDHRSIWASDTKRWKAANIILSEHSDTGGVLAVYPKDDHRIYLGVYNRINVYNKGLMGAVVDFKDNTVHSGWLVNSEKENIGFDPAVYVDAGSVVVTSLNSSTREHVTQRIPEALFDSIDTQHPNHTVGFEEEPFMGFLAGARLSKFSWVASSKVDVESTRYADVDHDIGDSLYKSLYLEGKIGNIDLALTYLRGEAEEKGGLIANASKALDFIIDFDQLFSPSSSLRVRLSDAEINGVATFHTDYEDISSTPDGANREFSSRLKRLSVLNMMERGWYFGGEYSRHVIPSAVGFSNSSKKIERVALDDDFKITTYELVFGYDEISYARRYETDMSRFYIQAMGGIGLGVYAISSVTKEEVEGSTLKQIDEGTYSIALDGSVDVGYIYQQRFKASRGLGYSLSAGYHVRGSWSGMGQSEKAETAADTLVLEMSRYDIWHGPFVSFNIIY